MNTTCWASIVALALEKQTIHIYQPFAGTTVGPFRVLSPHQNVYPFFIRNLIARPSPTRRRLRQPGLD